MNKTKLSQPFIICNPAAGEGLAARRWEKFRTQLREQALQFEYQLTRYPGHAAEISLALIAKGYRRIAVFGGDGTLNEVLQGLIRDDHGPPGDLQIIFLGAGSSCDFEKRFPKRLNLLERLLSDQPHTIDICKVECRDLNGSSVVRYFLNNSSVGVISLAIQKFNTARNITKLLKRFSVDAAALISGFKALMQFNELLCDINLDKEKIKGQKLSNLTVYKSPYFGGGMYFGKETKPDDGILSIAMIDAVPRLKLLGMIPSLYTGNIFSREAAHYTQCRTFELFTDQQVFVETDGEIIGYPPAKYSVIENRLSVII
ncbi:MAG: diacylglycerol kinase family protein, partial [Candidatus Neomarinimicrobiota bacterium]